MSQLQSCFAFAVERYRLAGLRPGSMGSRLLSEHRGEALNSFAVHFHCWVLIFPRGSGYSFLLFQLVSRPKQFHAQLVRRLIEEFRILAMRSVLQHWCNSRCFSSDGSDFHTQVLLY